LDRRLGEPESRSGLGGEEKILDPTGTRNSDLSVVQPVASYYTDCSISAPQLLPKELKMCALSYHKIASDHSSPKGKYVLSSQKRRRRRRRRRGSYTTLFILKF
jgi:hypothetical protein